jgi:hypothetical protein
MNIALAKNGVSDKIIKLITMALENVTAKFKIEGSMSDPFNIDSGVRQGDALSATLFNIALHETVKDTIKTGSIVNKSWQICAYADNLVIIARN